MRKGLFGSSSKDTFSRKEVEDLVKKAVKEAKEDEEEQTGNPALDKFMETATELLRDMKKGLDEEDEGRSKSSSGLPDIMSLMNNLQVNNAAQYGVDRNKTIVKGPADSAGNLLGGGPAYDPAGGGASQATNNRILKWCVNSIVFQGRGQLAFFTYFMVILSWNLLDLMDEDMWGGVGDSLFEDWITMSFWLGGSFGMPSGGTNSVSGIFGLFGNLFGNTGAGTLLDATNYYNTAV